MSYITQTTRWWQLKYVLMFTPNPGEMIQFESHKVEKDIHCKTVCSILFQWSLVCRKKRQCLVLQNPWDVSPLNATGFGMSSRRLPPLTWCPATTQQPGKEVGLKQWNCQCKYLKIVIRNNYQLEHRQFSKKNTPELEHGNQTWVRTHGPKPTVRTQAQMQLRKLLS